MIFGTFSLLLDTLSVFPGCHGPSMLPHAAVWQADLFPAVRF